MPEEGSKEFATAISSVFSGLGEFFSLFDVSFFVSGAACLGAILLVAYRGKAPNVEHESNVIGFIGLVTACYVLGMLMFTVGRGIRSTLLDRTRPRQPRPKSGVQFSRRATAYGLSPSDLSPLAGNLPPDEFYSLAWGMIRQLPECQNSLRFINKFWAMAATYDGAGAAALTWAVAFVLRWNLGGYLIASVFVVLALFCFARAEMYEDHQERELASTLAVVLLKARPAVPPPAVLPPAD